MLSRYIDSLGEHLPALKEKGQQLSSALHQAVLAGGEPARKVVDVLHGTWLGHPLHPVLTDVAIGGWVLGGLFDLLSLGHEDRSFEETADRLTAIGTYAAVPTALAGLADFSAIQKPAVSTATLHALANDISIGLYFLSLRDRRHGNRGRALALSMTALGLSSFSAWLGGHLVYRQQVGVDHSENFSDLEGWHGVLDEDDLPDGKMKRVTVDDKSVLLLRCDGAVHAIGSVCSHAGGPLDEGDADGCFVRCPWHDSVFDVRDGAVRHGPATRPQPTFDTRVRKGRIQIRLRQN